MTIFPIEDAEHQLRPCRPDLEREGATLRWPDHDGVSELTVEAVDYRTHDGLTVSERVTLTHTSEILNALPPRFATVMNRWATLSAFLPADAHYPARVTCKVDIFGTDRAAAERVYAPLICMEACVIGWYAARMSRGHFESDPDDSPLQQTDEPTPFDREAFAAAHAKTEQLGLVGSLGMGSYCVEFPWDPGALSRQFAIPELRAKLIAEGTHSEEDLERLAGATSLMQITSDERHALYGNGILSRLEIPVDTDDTSASSLVDELNRWELSGRDLPPLFGAWCMGPRAPTFVSFIPNQFCVPGLLENLLYWALVRHSRVRGWLTASRTSN